MARSRGRDAHLRGALPALLAPVLLVCLATPGSAQTTFGGFDDASVPGRWELRVRIPTSFEGTTDLFGGLAGTQGSSRVPLGARFSFDSLNAARLPIVAQSQRLLRDSVGLGTDIGLTLGSVTTGVRQLVVRVPFQLDLGVTRRVGLGITVPYVRTRAGVNMRVNAGGLTGNVGFNPSIGTDAAATASRTQNAKLFATLDTASRRLDSLVTACPAPSATNIPTACVPIIANRAGATQLARQTRTIANGIAQVYGVSTTRPGTRLVPIQGTDAQRAVNARLAALTTQYTAFARPELNALTLPSAAAARIANAGLQQVLTDPNFGVNADSVRTTEQAGLGDVEIGGHVMWLDTFGAQPVPNASGLRVRSTLGAAYRLATGASDVSYIWFDVPTGEGSTALVLRSATDVAFSRAFAASVVARVESPFASSIVSRIPPVAGELLAVSDRELTVDRTLGRQVHLEITPRWSITSAFAVAGHYAVRSKQEDRYTGSFAAADTTGGAAGVTYDASALGIGTGGRSQTYGFGFTYSTLAAFARGHAWAPVEVSYLHSSVFTASGGSVPAVRNDQLVVRVYAQLVGRSPRRPAAR